MGFSYCDENPYQPHCSDGRFTGWVNHDSVLSIGVDILLALAILGLVWWLLWWLFSYRRRPLCPYCQQEGQTTRVKAGRDVYKGQSVCYEHLLELLAADEPIYDCPRHHTPMKKEIDYDDGVIYDVCDEGCEFYDNREMDQLIENARSEGHSSGMATGIAIGIGAGSGFHSGH